MLTHSAAFFEAQPLGRGQFLEVHLLRSTAKFSAPELIRSNCRQVGQSGSPSCNHIGVPWLQAAMQNFAGWGLSPNPPLSSPPPTRIYQVAAVHHSTTPYPTGPPVATSLAYAPSVPVFMAYPYRPAPVAAQPIRTQAIPAQRAITQPVYHRNPDGTRVNMNHGSVTTESRGIHIRGVSHKITHSQLGQFLRSVGPPFETYELRRTSAGFSKGNAVVSYASTEAARSAVLKLDKKVLAGKRIEVKLDTNRRAVDSNTRADASSSRPSPGAGPVVANGS